MSAAEDKTDTPSSGERATAGSLALALAAYTLARLALVVVVAVVIVLGARLVDVDVPLYVAAVFGVLIGLPLGMALFKGLRLKVNRQIDAIDRDRKKRHDDLQSRLRGSK
mgnify:CR=1 FL=1